MPTYGQIKPVFWSDPDVLDLTPNQKLIFVYLFTNLHLTVSGIYPITIKTICFETGCDTEIVEDSLTKIKNIIYDFKNRAVYVRNRMRHRTGGDPKLLESGVKNDFNLTYKSPLWHHFVKDYPKYESIFNNGNIQLPLDTEVMWQPLDNLSATVEQPLDNLSATVEQRITVGQPLNNNNNNLTIKNRSSYNNSLKGNELPNNFKSFQKTLKESKNKTAVLVEAFKQWHNDAPSEDFEDLYNGIAGLISSAKKDHGLVLLIMHQSASHNITGFHIRYLHGMIQGKIKDKHQKEKEATINYRSASELKGK